MKSLLEMLNNTSKRYFNVINRNCSPLLEHLGISQYTFCKITNEGHFSLLTSYPDWIEVYFAKELYLAQPHFRHPNYFKCGISMPRAIPSESYQEVMKLAGKNFSVNSGIILVEKTKDAVIFNTFDLKKPSLLGEQLLVNEIKILEKFSHTFKEENQKLFGCLEDNQVNLKSILGNTFYEEPLEVLPSFNKRKTFIEQLVFRKKVVYALTTREIELLKNMQKGETSLEIGKKMFRSKRTIEKTLDQIKNKLNCESKKQLIEIARELGSLGYFQDI